MALHHPGKYFSRLIFYLAEKANKKNLLQGAILVSAKTCQTTNIQGLRLNTSEQTLLQKIVTKTASFVGFENLNYCKEYNNKINQKLVY